MRFLRAQVNQYFYAVNELNTFPRWNELYTHYIKRILDIFLVLLLSPVIGLILLIFGILVSLDGGKTFFAHRRVGRNGEFFNCWKLRSMTPDAEQLLKQHLNKNAAANREWQSTRKLKNDPRITPVGQIIRRLSIDELPQVWNVLTGDMSLVGPRPVTDDELQKYGAKRKEYLQCRPGITGLWQISGRNTVSYARRVELDADYAHNCGLSLDIKILFGTIKVITSPDGI